MSSYLLPPSPEPATPAAEPRARYLGETVAWAPVALKIRLLRANGTCAKVLRADIAPRGPRRAPALRMAGEIFLDDHSVPFAFDLPNGAQTATMEVPLERTVAIEHTELEIPQRGREPILASKRGFRISDRVPQRVRIYLDGELHGDAYED